MWLRVLASAAGKGASSERGAETGPDDGPSPRSSFPEISGVGEIFFKVFNYKAILKAHVTNARTFDSCFVYFEVSSMLAIGGAAVAFDSSKNRQ